MQFPQVLEGFHQLGRGQGVGDIKKGTRAALRVIRGLRSPRKKHDNQRPDAR